MTRRTAPIKLTAKAKREAILRYGKNDPWVQAYIFGKFPEPIEWTEGMPYIDQFGKLRRVSKTLARQMKRRTP